MRILVIGDSYCPSDALKPAFARLAPTHEITFRDVVDEPGWLPRHALRPAAARVHRAARGR